ncbi:hypothetical protein J6590_039859 [Homalodisca vitripennis]|nr:hypothetical protein J6590_039859 [Homalodisca vitripennis]
MTSSLILSTNQDDKKTCSPSPGHSPKTADQGNQRQGNILTTCSLAEELEMVKQHVQKYEDQEETDLETSLTIAAEAGNLLLKENSNLVLLKQKSSLEVGASQTTQKKLNDTTTLYGQHLCCSPNIDTVGASQTTQKKLNNTTTLYGQHLCCSPNIDTVGASQTTQKKLNYNILQPTQLKNPPSTAKIRPDELRSPDLVILTEHGLKESQLSSTRLPGYNLIGGFPRQNCRKGGVAAFASEGLRNEIYNFTTDLASELTCETHVVQMTMGKTTIYIIGVYRPRKYQSGSLDNALNILSSTIDLIPTWKCPTIIMGDINVDGLNHDYRNRKLKDMLASHNINRIDLPPTRVTLHTESSIDFVCSNLDKSKIDTDLVVTGLSDHIAQLCTIITLNK